MGERDTRTTSQRITDEMNQLRGEIQRLENHIVLLEELINILSYNILTQNLEQNGNRKGD